MMNMPKLSCTMCQRQIWQFSFNKFNRPGFQIIEKKLVFRPPLQGILVKDTTGSFTTICSACESTNSDAAYEKIKKSIKVVNQKCLQHSQNREKQQQKIQALIQQKRQIILKAEYQKKCLNLIREQTIRKFERVKNFKASIAMVGDNYQQKIEKSYEYLLVRCNELVNEEIKAFYRRMSQDNLTYLNYQMERLEQLNEMYQLHVDQLSSIFTKDKVLNIDVLEREKKKSYEKVFQESIEISKKYIANIQLMMITIDKLQQPDIINIEREEEEEEEEEEEYQSADRNKKKDQSNDCEVQIEKANHREKRKIFTNNPSILSK